MPNMNSTRNFLTFPEVKKQLNLEEIDLVFAISEGQLKPCLWSTQLERIWEWDWDDDPTEVEFPQPTKRPKPSADSKPGTVPQPRYDPEPMHSVDKDVLDSLTVEHHWCYLHLPSRDGQFDCTFKFAARDRDAHWPTRKDRPPFDVWYFLPHVFDMKDLREKTVFLLEDVQNFQLMKELKKGDVGKSTLAAIDAPSSDYPLEMNAAMIAFNAVKNGYGTQNSFKKNLEEYLREKFSELGVTFIDRASTIANPDKSTGRKKDLTNRPAIKPKRKQGLTK